MSDIYARSIRTLVYLGEAANNSDKALRLLEEIGKPDSGMDLDVLLLELPPNGDPSWKALRILWGRPWFRRVWVIQEFVLPPDVLMVCGEWEGDWMTFHLAAQKSGLFLRNPPTIFNVFEYMALEAGASAMALMTGIRVRYIGMTLQSRAPNDMLDSIDLKKRQDSLYPHYDLAKGPEIVLPMQRSWFHNRKKSSSLFSIGGGFSLLQLLSCCERSDSTRARDHLFAVLGLASDAEDELFRPDYTVPFEKVVRRYGKAFVRNGKCMELLYKCRLGLQPWRFPSWIPDWTTKYITMNADAVRSYLGDSELYCAARNSQCQARVDDIEDSLIVRGGFIDTVIWTGSIPTSTTMDKLNRTIPTSLVQVHGILWPLYFIREALVAMIAITRLTPLRRYPTGEPLHEVLWRTLIANQTYEGLAAPDDFGDLLSHLLWRLWRIDRFSDDLESLSPQAARIWLKRSFGEAYYESLISISPSYKLVITKDSYFGLAPLLTKVGDRICILNGGAVPFVFVERYTRG
jgi:hypothetical protein